MSELVSGEEEAIMGETMFEDTGADIAGAPVPQTLARGGEEVIASGTASGREGSELAAAPQPTPRGGEEVLASAPLGAGRGAGELASGARPKSPETSVAAATPSGVPSPPFASVATAALAEEEGSNLWLYLGGVGLVAVAGGGGGSSAPANVQIAGQVFDGPISGALVYVDVDGNGSFGAGDIEIATTDTSGFYSGEVPAQHRDKFIKVDLSNAVDTDPDNDPSTTAQAALDGTISYRSAAPVEAFVANDAAVMVLSPLTELVAKRFDTGASDVKVAAEAAAQAVADDLGLRVGSGADILKNLGSGALDSDTGKGVAAIADSAIIAAIENAAPQVQTVLRAEAEKDLSAAQVAELAKAVVNPSQVTGVRVELYHQTNNAKVNFLTLDEGVLASDTTIGRVKITKGGTPLSSAEGAVVSAVTSAGAVDSVNFLLERVGTSDFWTVKAKNGASFDHETAVSQTLYVGSSVTATLGFAFDFPIAVNLTDIVDEAAQFAKDSYSFTAAEGIGASDIIGNIAATPDVLGGAITYAITAGNTSGNGFSVDANGNIKVAAGALEGGAASYTLTVSATEAGFSGTADTSSVTITIAADDAPSFTSANTAEAFTNIGAGVGFHTLVATPDIAGKAVTYSIKASSDTAGRFAIGGTNNNELMLASGKSFPDTANNSETYTVTVVAREAGSSLMREQEISITVTDDRPPVFSASGGGAVTLDEGSGSDGTELFTGVPTASDPDPNDTTILYTLSAHNDLFEYDGGKIKQKAALPDVDAPGAPTSYSFTVNAYATGKPSAVGRSDTYTVNIRDINDQAPVFTSTSRNVFISEDAPGASIQISSVSATPDVAGASLTYSIVSVNGASSGTAYDLFEVSNSGVLSLATGDSFDFEAAPTLSGGGRGYVVVISAGVGSYVTSGNQNATVNISVGNVYDAAPTIANGASHTITIDETASGTLAVISATADAAFTGSIVYGLTHSVFQIDASTGAITLKQGQSLDHESGTTSYSLSITAATTQAGTTLSSTQALTINLRDINETAPTYTGNTSGNINISSVADGDEIATLSATTDNGELAVFAFDNSGTHDNGKFVIEGGKLKVKAGATFTAGTLTVKITASVSGANNTTLSTNQTITITAISSVSWTGTSGADTNTGTSAQDIMEGLAGGDKMDGGTGIDTLSYASDTAGVTINLNQTPAASGTDQGFIVVAGNSGSHAAGDKFKSFENVIGGSGNDTLIGKDGEANELDGRGGDDTLSGGGGADVLKGGAGNDKFVLELAATKRAKDVVRDFTRGNDVIQLTVTADQFIAITSIATLKSQLGLGITNNSNSSGTSTNDTIITWLGAAGSTDDVDVMVLEDYATALTLADFELISATAGFDVTRLGASRAMLSSLVINDADGNGTFTYKWQRSDDGATSWSDISGATSASYAPASGDDGKYVRLHVSYTDGASNAETVTSAATKFKVDAVASGTATGTAGRDYMYASGTAAVTLNGGAGDDILVGGDGIDTLEGGAGNDIIEGGGGVTLNAGMTAATAGDTLRGGAGIDTLSYASASAAVTVQINMFDSFDSNVGTATTGDAAGDKSRSFEILVGSAHNDALSALLSFDITRFVTIYGGAGNDSITGSNGADTLYGEAGNDSFSGQRGDDLMIGGAGNDSFNGGSGFDTVSYATSSAAVTVTIGAPQSGNTGGDAANDAIGGSVDSLIGSDFADTLGGSFKNDVLDGGLGGTAGDTLRGGFGGTDTASYARSHAAVTVTVNAITGNTGGHAHNDKLYGIENLIGSDFADTLTGDARNNQLDGGFGDDTLIGGAGDDTLIGRGGADTMSGGAGDDIFALEWVAARYARDVVTDFASGDKIRVVTSAGSETSLTALRNAAKLRWSNDSNLSGASDNDTAIYHTNGTASESDDSLLMVLEDYNDALAIADFKIIDPKPVYVWSPTQLKVEPFLVEDSPDGIANVHFKWESSTTGNSGWSEFFRTIPETTSSSLNGRYIRISPSYDDVDGTRVTLAPLEPLKVTRGSGDLTGTANVDDWLVLTGSADSDLSGLSGDDFLAGNSGDNVLDGGAGRDVLFGNTGDDSYVLELGDGKRAADVVDGFRVATEAGGEVSAFDVIAVAFSSATTPTTLAALRTAANIRWTVDSHYETQTSENDVEENDTVIYYTNGTASTADDEVVMVLTDVTDALTFDDFDMTVTII